RGCWGDGSWLLVLIGKRLGRTQSGRLPRLNLARLDRDVDILNEAMQAAEVCGGW
ncbi:unnamed protein product, partial [Closterium sp. Naga37s-1]